jgi:hypothetical protein
MRRALLEYCRRDTLALVVLLRALRHLGAGPRSGLSAAERVDERRGRTRSYWSRLASRAWVRAIEACSASAQVPVSWPLVAAFASFFSS